MLLLIFFSFSEKDVYFRFFFASEYDIDAEKKKTHRLDDEIKFPQLLLLIKGRDDS